MLSRRSIIAFTGTAILGGLGRVAEAADKPALLGEWSGTLRADAQTFRLTLRILSDTRGEMISPDQSSEAVPIGVRLSGSGLTVTVPAAQASFVGRRRGEALIGEWRQGGARIPLTLVRGSALPPTAPVVSLTQSGLEALRVAAGTPALAAGWQKKGNASRILASGRRAADSPILAMPDDLWHLGSVTKSMTATLVARLVDMGAVRWTDTVQTILGERVSAVNPAYRDVNFLHLLSHHSGLPSDIPDAQWRRYFSSTQTPSEQRVGFAAQALSLPPTGTAGKDFRYSNLGVTIAAFMLEICAGAPWEKLMAEQLFGPLGLSSAGFGAPVSGKDVRQPIGHTSIGADVPGARLFAARPDAGRPIDNPAVIGPAGNVHMTIDDLLTFLAAHRDRTALLAPASWETLHRPPFGGEQALGLVARPDGSLWHNGSNTLWYCEVNIDTRRGTVAAAVANRFSSATRAAVAEALAGARSAAGA